MLTRNCAIKKLLKEEDFNVKVTVTVDDIKRCSKDPNRQKREWFSVIHYVIGREILNSSDTYKIIIHDETGRHFSFSSISGNAITSLIDELYKKPVGIRITIARSDGTSPWRTWIIV